MQQTTLFRPPKLQSNFRWLLCAVLLFGVAPLVTQLAPGRFRQTLAAGNQAAGKSSALPALQGEAAVEHLKQQGLYDSLDQAVQATRYGVRWTEQANLPGAQGAYAAANPAQQFHSYFTPSGLSLETAGGAAQGWRVAMELSGVGYGSRLTAVSAGEVKAAGSRVEIRRTLSGGQATTDQSAITEWYENRPAGLEQGFTLTAAPGERRAGERLRLAMKLAGGLRPRLTAQGQAVALVDKGGREALRYDHLAAYDATGRALPARLAVTDDEVRLEVEDEVAVYPVTIDPTITQQAYLKASNTGASDFFGISVAVSGDTVVVGAWQEDSSTSGVNSTPNESASVSGAAYVFNGVGNTPPTIAATGVTRTQGTSGNSQIASVLDAEDDENTLTVTATPNSSTGVTISSIAVDGSGNVTADVSAACNATTSTFTLTVTDSQSATATDTLIVTVTPNPAPVVTITGPASGSIFAVGTQVNFTGTFTDNAGGTHTASWMFDSITQSTTVVEPSASTPGSADTTYTFTQAGVYTVKLTVTDGCGLSGTATTVGEFEAMVVIYDPGAGWVTGGGWINSPAGAYVPNPMLTGKANFGFVSKYQNGASVPTGNTEFQFKAGNLNFKSTSYEWMVISGGKKAQYKGSGTINGSGSYRFMLTAIDGDQPGGGGQDKFRIRIWSDGGGMVYDNQINDPDSNDPTTVLGGGSIVIHKQ